MDHFKVTLPSIWINISEICMHLNFIRDNLHLPSSLSKAILSPWRNFRKKWYILNRLPRDVIYPLSSSRDRLKSVTRHTWKGIVPNKLHRVTVFIVSRRAFFRSRIVSIFSTFPVIRSRSTVRRSYCVGKTDTWLF